MKPFCSRLDLRASAWRDVATWGELLAEIDATLFPGRLDAVVNAAGIFRGDEADFEAIHRLAPAALFQACADHGGLRVLQISALGADTGEEPYFRTKRAADDFLLSLAPKLEPQILRPAPIFSTEGASSRLFLSLASLPLAPAPAGGRQPFDPVDIRDVAELALALLDPATPPGQVVEARGGSDANWRETLAGYRRLMGFPRALVFPVPRWAAAFGAKIAGRFPGSLLTADSWSMLQSARRADKTPAERLLGRPLRPIEGFMTPAEGRVTRAEALGSWRGPLLRTGLAFLWLWTAWASAFGFSRETSLSWLALSGVPAWLAPWALAGACLADAALGVATLLWPRRRLWLAQAGLIVFYTVVLSCSMPELWLNPFGPLSKNVPILAVLALLFAEERRP
jgi:uncharacterized protein YbjT (DUF2867 family)